MVDVSKSHSDDMEDIPSHYSFQMKWNRFALWERIRWNKF